MEAIIVSLLDYFSLDPFSGLRVVATRHIGAFFPSSFPPQAFRATLLSLWCSEPPYLYNLVFRTVIHSLAFRVVVHSLAFRAVVHSLAFKAVIHSLAFEPSFIVWHSESLFIV